MRPIFFIAYVYFFAIGFACFILCIMHGNPNGQKYLLQIFKLCICCFYLVFCCCGSDRVLFILIEFCSLWNYFIEGTITKWALFVIFWLSLSFCYKTACTEVKVPNWLLVYVCIVTCMCFVGDICEFLLRFQQRFFHCISVACSVSCNIL